MKNLTRRHEDTKGFIARTAAALYRFVFAVPWVGVTLVLVTTAVLSHFAVAVILVFMGGCGDADKEIRKGDIDAQGEIVSNTLPLKEIRKGDIDAQGELVVNDMVDDSDWVGKMTGIPALRKGSRKGEIDAQGKLIGNWLPATPQRAAAQGDKEAKEELKKLEEQNNPND